MSQRQCCLHPEADHRDQHPRVCFGEIWHFHDEHCGGGSLFPGKSGWCVCRCNEWKPAEP